LAMRRVKRGDEVWLELKGSIPARRQGPPLHIHFAEDEEGVVRSGTLSAVLNGRRFTAGPGEQVSLLADRPTGGGTTGMNPWCSKAMCGQPWISTDFSKRPSKSSTPARPAGLRSSTWPISSYGIVRPRP
jgi:hypothetical protein